MIPPRAMSAPPAIPSASPLPATASITTPTTTSAIAAVIHARGTCSSISRPRA